MRRALFGVGCLALLVGLVWIGQGTGVFPYPRRSFMISEIAWAYRGGALALMGCVGVWLSRRIRG